MWTQTLTFVDDGVDAVVKGGDRRLYVHDPSSGQKMELGYSDNTTVGELRERVQVLLRYRGRMVMGSGRGKEAHKRRGRRKVLQRMSHP